MGDPRDIEIVGDDISRRVLGLPGGRQPAPAAAGDLLWFGPLKALPEASSSARPLVHLFIFGSEAYHDYYRWPLKDRRTFERWKRDTAWGQLFDGYEKEVAGALEAGPRWPAAG